MAITHPERPATDPDARKATPETEHHDSGARYGISQIGAFDHVPATGYREYWYPALLAREVGKRPKLVKLLGEEVVFFRGKDRRVVALDDRCPHRGARLSLGRCEYEGTISCPYHGFTYDETGVCVAAITAGPDSPLAGKLRTRHYPTGEVRGVVFVWMGQTEPVPLEEDVPEELFDPSWAVFKWVNEWPVNWSISTLENAGDAHDSYLHRVRFRRFFSFAYFSNWRQSTAHWSGTRVVEEGEKHIGIAYTGVGPQQAYYPLLGKKWPQHVWWRFLPIKWGEKNHTGKPYNFTYRLPSIVQIDIFDFVHMRWGVPIDKHHTRMFYFGLRRAPGRWRNWLARLYLATVYRYQMVQGANELEDVPVLRELDPDAPQKLGANDRGIIFWRRRMPYKSRDAQRVWKKKDADQADADTPIPVGPANG